jgi:hypothetical protein
MQENPRLLAFSQENLRLPHEKTLITLAHKKTINRVLEHLKKLTPKTNN